MLTQARLHQVLSYEPKSGVFTYLLRSGGFKVGDTAGAHIYDHGACKIHIDGKWYPSHQLAWLYTHGEMQDVTHINGIKSDNRLANLIIAKDFAEVFHDLLITVVLSSDSHQAKVSLGILADKAYKLLSIDELKLFSFFVDNAGEPVIVGRMIEALDKADIKLKNYRAKLKVLVDKELIVGEYYRMEQHHNVGYKHYRLFWERFLELVN